VTSGLAIISVVAVSAACHVGVSGWCGGGGWCDGRGGGGHVVDCGGISESVELCRC
jgi:hypothetical protein